MSNTIDEWRKRFSLQGKDKTPTGQGNHELVVNAGPSKEVYEAFGAQDKVIRFDVRCVNTRMGHNFPYTTLYEITYRNNYTDVMLTVSGSTVTISGRNLRPLVEAFKLHKCDFIQEYHSDLYVQPLDESAPFISRIEVKLRKGADK